MHNLKQNFLNKYIFQGLTDLNDGFDTEKISYFSEADFKIVLDRIEKMKIGVYGMEPWLNETFYDVASYEDYTDDPMDSNWYRQAFEEFVSKKENLCYSASYYIPQIENKIS